MERQTFFLCLLDKCQVPRSLKTKTDLTAAFRCTLPSLCIHNKCLIMKKEQTKTMKVDNPLKDEEPSTTKGIISEEKSHSTKGIKLLSFLPLWAQFIVCVLLVLFLQGAYNYIQASNEPPPKKKPTSTPSKRANQEKYRFFSKELWHELTPFQNHICTPSSDQMEGNEEQI